MPDLKRFCFATAAAVLLAAIAGGQEKSPFPQPPRMPPEIMPRHSLLPHPRTIPEFRIEIDNAQVRAMRYKLRPYQSWTLPEASSPGQLLVAVTDLDFRTPSSELKMSAGEVRWVTAANPRVNNLASTECEFLLIQPKRN